MNIYLIFIFGVIFFCFFLILDVELLNTKSLYPNLLNELKDCFDYSLYWQRNLVECLFSALKRLFGTSLSSLSAKTQRAELYMRLIAYNLGYFL